MFFELKMFRGQLIKFKPFKPLFRNSIGLLIEFYILPKLSFFRLTGHHRFLKGGDLEERIMKIKQNLRIR